jgi:hypothetical protein
VNNTPSDIAVLLAEIAELETDYGPAAVGIGVLGESARLLEVMLTSAGLEVRHVPGLAVKVTSRHSRR